MKQAQVVSLEQHSGKMVGTILYPTPRGFEITRRACVVCGEPPFGDEHYCGHGQAPTSKRRRKPARVAVWRQAEQPPNWLRLYPWLTDVEVNVPFGLLCLYVQLGASL